MKKIFLLLVCVALTVGVNAQIRFGAKVGGTFSNLTIKGDGEKLDYFKPGIGFQIGGVLEYSFSESLALQPELLYVMDNSKIKNNAFDGLFEDLDGVSASAKMALQVIQLPINLKYKMGTESLKFYVTAGPYLGYILSGKMKAKATAEGNSVSASFDMFDDNSGLEAKRFDFGVGAGFGIEVSKFTVGVGYQYGIANLTGAKEGSLKLGTFNLSVGYFF
jgi:hypothetical protein